MSAPSVARIVAGRVPLEEVVTIMYRSKGSDLAAFRASRIDRDELRKRVQVKEF